MSRRAIAPDELVATWLKTAPIADVQAMLKRAKDILDVRAPDLLSVKPKQRGRPEGSRNKPKVNTAPDRTPGVAAILGEPA